MPQFALCILSLLPSVALCYHSNVLFKNRASPAVRRAVTPTLRGQPNPEEDADARARLERMFAASRLRADCRQRDGAGGRRRPEPTTDAPTTASRATRRRRRAAEREPADPEPVEVGVPSTCRCGGWAGWRCPARSSSRR